MTLIEYSLMQQREELILRHDREEKIDWEADLSIRESFLEISLREKHIQQQCFHEHAKLGWRCRRRIRALRFKLLKLWRGSKTIRLNYLKYGVTDKGGRYNSLLVKQYIEKSRQIEIEYDFKKVDCSIQKEGFLREMQSEKKILTEFKEYIKDRRAQRTEERQKLAERFTQHDVSWLDESDSTTTLSLYSDSIFEAVDPEGLIN